MDTPLKIYNTIKREKQVFTPLVEGKVGIYLCGPTVYGHPHLGHARPTVVFDVVHRYFKYLGYKVRFVRNVTDVGHLVDEVACEGESRIEKKARLEQLEPMEVVKFYTDSYHKAVEALNAIPPHIEPTASGHIPEQIEWVEKIIEAGYAYEVNGSVYFDVEKYHADYKNYGQLSGRVLEDLLTTTRDNLEGQEEKRSRTDFAIWKAAAPEHIMRWRSPWGEGFPGWHLECSVMSTKYLGEQFDIHGGGMDLLFPHHEAEIAQSVACCGKESVRYWMHNNMITVNGKKMGKSYNNFITIDELFNGTHEMLEQAYSPMTIRFFILQAHYRSTVDFSNKALQAAEKGYKRMMNAAALLSKLQHRGNNQQVNAEADATVVKICHLCYEHINDDFNTALVLADLFELASKINTYANKQANVNELSTETFKLLLTTYHDFVFDILGLKDETLQSGNDNSLSEGLMDLILTIRSEARSKKDWGTADLIRDKLKDLNVVVKDSKEGTNWTVN